MTAEYLYTLTITQADAEALARGEVPRDVQNLIVSLLLDVQATPAEALASMARRRKAARA